MKTSKIPSVFIDAKAIWQFSSAIWDIVWPGWNMIFKGLPTETILWLYDLIYKE